MKDITQAIKLTSRQKEILDYISTMLNTHGFPPTRAEIATQFQFKSPNASEAHLRALARKGAIELLNGTSRGIRVKMEQIQATVTKVASNIQEINERIQQINIPLVGRVAAGAPILAAEHVEQSYCVESNLFSSQPDYLLKVRGMSMKDAGIMDGDLLAVQSTKDAKNGQIVVARIGEEVTVKRFKKTGNTIELIPENPDFQVITVKPGDSFEIEGLAVGLIRNSFFM